MATAMRKPETSAVSTERLRTWRTSMSGSAWRSSWKTHSADQATLSRRRGPAVRAEVQPQPPPSLSTTETPTMAAPRVTMPRGSKRRRGAPVDRRGRTTTASARATATVIGPEPEGGLEVEDLGDQAGDRIAQTGADGGGDREGGDGPARPARGELAAGDGHGHRQQAEADALESPPDHQHGEARSTRPRARSRPAPRPGPPRPPAAWPARRPGGPWPGWPGRRS